MPFHPNKFTKLRCNGFIILFHPKVTSKYKQIPTLAVLIAEPYPVAIPHPSKQALSKGAAGSICNQTNNQI